MPDVNGASRSNSAGNRAPYSWPGQPSGDADGPLVLSVPGRLEGRRTERMLASPICGGYVGEDGGNWEAMGAIRGSEGRGEERKKVS